MTSVDEVVHGNVEDAVPNCAHHSAILEITEDKRCKNQANTGQTRLQLFDYRKLAVTIFAGFQIPSLPSQACL